MSERMRGLKPRAHVLHVSGTIDFTATRGALDHVLHQVCDQHDTCRGLNQGTRDVRRHFVRKVLVLGNQINVILGQVAVIEAVAQ